MKSIDNRLFLEKKPIQEVSQRNQNLVCIKSESPSFCSAEYGSIIRATSWISDYSWTKFFKTSKIRSVLKFHLQKKNFFDLKQNIPCKEIVSTSYANEKLGLFVDNPSKIKDKKMFRIAENCSDYTFLSQKPFGKVF